MAGTDRKAITLSKPTWDYLDELAKLGTHGTTAPGVASTLVEIGIRQLIEQGIYLRIKRPDEDTPVS